MKNTDDGELLWNNSTFNTLRLCEQKFVYEHIDGLEPKDKAYVLLLGSWFHALMYAQGLRQGVTQGTLLHGVPDLMDLGIDGLAPVSPEEMGLFVDKGRSFTRAVHAYIMDNFHTYLPTNGEDEVAGMPDFVWNLYCRYMAAHMSEVLTEEVLGVEVEWTREEKDADGVTRTYGGKVDRIVKRADGLVVIRDYKTTGQKPTSDFRLSNSQLHLYAWGVAPMLAEHDLSPDLIEYDYALTYPITMRVTKAGALYKNQKVMDDMGATMLMKEMGLNPTDEKFQPYLQKCREEGNAEFFSRSAMPVNVTVIQNLLSEQERLQTIAEDLRNGAHAVRNRGRHCDYMCPYKAVCVGDLYGNDTSALRAEFNQKEVA